MKKKSVIIKESKPYEILNVVNNTALVNSLEGMTGILNIKTRELVGNFDFYDRNTVKDSLFINVKKVETNTNIPTPPREYLRVYDCVNEKMLVNDWLIVEKIDKYNFVVLKSPENNKMYFFDLEHIDRLQNSYDNIETLFSEYHTHYFAVTQNGKKGLFCNNEGLIHRYEYININVESCYGKNIVIFSNDYGKKIAVDNKIKDLSPIYEKIEFDKQTKCIIYCKNETSITVYDLRGKRVLFSLPIELVDDIKVLKFFDFRYDEGIYYFLLEKNGKVGCITACNNNKEQKFEEKVPIMYDNIEFESNCTRALLLHKDKKVGALIEKYLYEPEYDKIENISKENHIFYKNNLADIVNIKWNSCNTLIEKCEVKKIYDSLILYFKDNKYGLFLSYGPPTYSDGIFNFYGYDSIQQINKKWFILESEEKYGLFYEDKISMEPQYVKIDLKKQKIDYQELYYLLLYKNDEEFQLGKIVSKSWCGEEIKVIGNTNYRRVEFLNDFIVCYSDTSTDIYNYDDCFIRSFSPNTQISFMEEKNSNNKTYSIDGKLFFYKDEKLEEAHYEELELYATMYEFENGTIVVNDYNKVLHDRKCYMIERIRDSKIEDKLLSMSQESPEIIKKYPSLTKKIFK